MTRSGRWGSDVVTKNRWMLAATLVATAGLITACGSSAPPAERAGDAETTAPQAVAAPPVTLVSVVDGDTIDTSAGTVRILGIDTPERGQCGHDEASVAISGLLAPGDALTLTLPAGENDHDDYGRLIRYVTTGSGVDLGMLQLQAGNAVARYDSHDGYPAHPKEGDYHAAQTATLDATGTVVTGTCAAAAAAAAPAPEPPTPVAAPVAEPAAPAADPWWRRYSSCSKLKKNGVGDPTGPFSRDDPAQAEIYDWFENGTGNHGDGDGDGLACE
jgi:micrococcal nuclease